MWLEEEDTPVREQNDSVLPAMRAVTVENSKPSALTWSERLALIGPAFVAGAWQFGPGNLTSAVEAGSAYGYSLIWVIVLSTILMIAFTDMSVRIGIIARGSMIQTIKDTLGKPVGVLAGISVFFITLCFSVGNAAGSGLALSMLFGGSSIVWTLVCSVAVGFILLMRNVYGVVERILLALVAMMAIGFVCSAILARPDWIASAAGVIPTFPPSAQLLIIALVGTNFSINAAFFTSYATRAKGTRADQYRDSTITDTLPGIIAPGIMTCLVIMVAAAVLGHTGERVQTLVQLANVFQPLAGSVGSTLFVLGFFAAAFSSMLANATAGGTLLSDGVGWGGSFDALRTKILVACVLAFGALVVALAPGSRVQLIIFAQAMTVLVAPFLAGLLMIISNGQEMGAMRNTVTQNVLGACGFLSILAASGLLVYKLSAMLGS
ncbi:NRAMP (natural resistance-associated macrophage protein) metal ion transporters [Rhizobium sp. RU33A]|uniref:Nramp family divalent metal transporter n=1 Tax=Rhizobium sp. RU33A TaxID=1907413 RepID=UPI00095519AC|nr:Nramp family divalent metal transporter [Rhizobium sp. RU33A]SIQ85925.1 NRAMP (natural resistance-associated macrophage protein) metal ion transporters [Rhizobium sp. RU33A]